MVCAAPLRRPPVIGLAPPDPFPSCDAARCRLLVGRRAELGDAGLRRLLQIQCRQAAEQRRAEQGRQARRDLEQRENAACQAAMRPALQALQARLAGLAGGAQPAAPVDELLHLVLPSGPRRQRQLGPRRRERYRHHLQRCLATLIAPAPAGPAELEPAMPPPPAPGAGATTPAPGPAWAGSLCGVCRGGCCTRGGDTAYLDTQTLQRCMQQHPQWGAEAVLARYLAHLPAASMAGSCIHHTRQGCSLPGEMRSQTCNQFQCGPLALLQAPGRPVQAVVVIQRRQSHWHSDDPALDNPITGSTLLSADGAVALRSRR